MTANTFRGQLISADAGRADLWIEHPAKQCTSTLSSDFSVMAKLGLRSSCAGHRARHLLTPVFLTPLRRDKRTAAVNVPPPRWRRPRNHTPFGFAPSTCFLVADRCGSYINFTPSLCFRLPHKSLDVCIERLLRHEGPRADLYNK